MLSQIKRWTCDGEGCASMIEYGSYGMPKGWMWYSRGGETLHACPECVVKMRAAGYGTAKRSALQLTNVPGAMIR